MCGILGSVTAPGHVGPSGAHRRALQAIDHRGPDGRGEYERNNVWLGHTRLSILDLSAAGAQPMRSADDRFVISYNGEVYNFRELARQMGFENLRSRGDTEVVLQLFAALKTDSLVKLNGMFAFAVYDTHAEKLWLARDRLGIKPLYYLITPTQLVFASEIKGIISLLKVRPRFDIEAMHEWLYYGNTLGGRTLYDGITQLLPGHYLELDLRSFDHQVREYWSLCENTELGLAQDDKQCVISGTRALLEQAVRRQLVSDVPVGVFLSGGVDSSAITAFASRHYEGRLATYSVGFDFSPDGGELPRAKRVADLYGTDHHELHISGKDVGDLVEKMVHHHDMPFSDAANLPLYLMAAEISAHTKVVLQGDGGDELFGGYRRYFTLRHYRVLHQAAKVLQRFRMAKADSAFYYRVMRYLHALAAEDLGTTMALLLTVEDRHSAPLNIFSPSFAESVDKAADPFARFRELQRRFAGHDIGNQMSFVDMSIVLPDIYLEKVDRSTMAASLEVRVPFLDHDLVDHVVRIPGRSKMPCGKKKWLLKTMLKGIVPDEVLYAPKRGFAVPYGDWLQSFLKPLFLDHLAQFVRTQPDVLDVDHVHELFSQTSSGQQNHSHLLWKILNLLIWANNTPINLDAQRAG